MGTGERTLYPMLGVGAFFVMFWIGFVVGYELGLGCWLFLLNALFFACLGAWFVVRLESADICRQLPAAENFGNNRRTTARSSLSSFSQPYVSNAGRHAG